MLFTHDDDLLAIAQERQTRGVGFAGLVYTHMLRLTIGQCVEDLGLLAECLDPEDMLDRVEYLPQR